MHALPTLIAVAAGGAVGAVLRFGVAVVVRAGTPWPDYIATLISNLIGCFAIGLAFVYLEGADRPTWLRALLVTGLLGAFTTFSTFSLEAMHLIHARRLTELAAYISVSVVIGLATVKAGMWTMERLG